jgi:electron transfer flavoprotein beta subunit
MQMIVCMKQVFDPEISPDRIRIDAAGTGVVLPADIPEVLNPYDEHALEAALRLKDCCGGTITVVSLGHNLTRKVVKKSLAMGADELVLAEDPLFKNIDTRATAHCLAAAIRKLGEFDLIFCGRQAAPWDSGQVGPGLAELLGIPCVTVCRRVEAAGEHLEVEKCLDDGFEVVEAAVPLLVTVSSEVGKPRYPTLRGIRMATRREPTVWTRAQLPLGGTDGPAAGPGQGRGHAGLESGPLPVPRLLRPQMEAHCEFIDSESPEEAGERLADRLRENKLL